MGSPCVSMSVSMCSTNGFRWTQVPNPITCSIKPGTAPGRSPKFQILGLKTCKDWRMMRIHPNYGSLNGFVGEFDPFFAVISPAIRNKARSSWRNNAFFAVKVCFQLFDPKPKNQHELQGPSEVAANHILQQNGLHFVPQKSAGKTSKHSLYRKLGGTCMHFPS